MKSIGDLIIELAHLMGECTYCKNDKEECSGECRFVNKRRTAVEAVTASVDRQIMVQVVPVAKLRVGMIVPASATELLDEKVVQAVYDMSQGQNKKGEATEDGKIAEDQTTEMRKGNDPSSVLDACNFEEKSKSI